jgi:hypothetical protein
MPVMLKNGLLAVLAGCLWGSVLRAEVVDRILAVAGGRAITWSAALTDANCRAFLVGEPPRRFDLNQPSETDKLQESMEHLIDQMVIERARERAVFILGSSDAEIAPEDDTWKDIAAAYPSPAEMQKALEHYGIDEESLRARVARERRILAFLDYSLRPQVRISTEQVEAYYQDVFVPQLQRQDPNAVVPELSEVRPKIEEVLVQQELNRLTGPWLERLRREQGVRYLGTHLALPG